ncbi:MAG: endonuclease [Prevotella sp.]|nr:endonuclease [Prevotella sp.]
MFISLLLSSWLTMVELNCENLFDTRHDSLKQDVEYLPEATRHWTRKRYWRKLNNIAQEILSTCDDGIPDLVALCEVENDTVLHDLTRRSLLRGAGYDYVMTSSPDLRGIDVALLYSPFSFRLLTSHSIRVEPVKDMRPTRDILYASGLVVGGDTLHIFVIHAPSRYGGERYSRPFRQAVADRLLEAVDSVQATAQEAHILIAGDFNDEADGPVLKRIYRQHRLRNLTKDARGQNGVRGTYRYKGRWGSIDHVLGSRSMYNKVDTAYIHAPSFLLESDNLYGGYQPRRTYVGIRYQSGYSDHLPLVIRFHH